MRFAAAASAVTAMVCLTGAPVVAGQHGHAGSAAPPHTAPQATHGPSVGHGPTTHGPTTHGPMTHGPATHAPSTHGPSTHATGAPTTKGSSPTTTTTNTTETTNGPAGGASTPTAVDFTTGPVAQHLSRNTALTSKLETRLAALGYQGTVYEAAYGFKNLGQFVAAVNVSQNLGLSFDQLKVQMTGLSVLPDGTIQQANVLPDGTVTMVDPADVTSPAPASSLGQSIHTLNSTVDSTGAAQSATADADAEIAN
jgi:hypothetical protein